MKLIPSIQDDNELKLWHKMLEGDPAAFSGLLNSTYDLLFQYGNKFSRDRELVKDCIQDIYLEVWEKRSSLNGDIPPRAYLLASLRRRLNRVGQRNQALPFDSLDDVAFDMNYSIEYRLIRSEEDAQTAKRITYLLNALPKRQKEAVYLKFFLELDRDQIAAVMDIRPQSVSNLLQTAFKWLKEHWKTAIFFALLLSCLQIAGF